MAVVAYLYFCSREPCQVIFAWKSPRQVLSWCAFEKDIGISHEFSKYLEERRVLGSDEHCYNISGKMDWSQKYCPSSQASLAAAGMDGLIQEMLTELNVVFKRANIVPLIVGQRRDL